MADKFIICNNEDEIKTNESCYGNHTFEISAKDLIALFEGKTIATTVYLLNWGNKYEN